MSGRLPERQVKTKASYARTISDKRKTARQAIPPGTLSPEPQTKAAAGGKAREWSREIYFFFHFHSARTHSFTGLHLFLQFCLTNVVFWESCKHCILFPPLSLCVCVYVCALMFPCTCMNESSQGDPTLCGRLIWRAGSIWPPSVCLSEAAHNWALCFKCHSSQRKGRHPLALFFFLFCFVLPDPHNITAWNWLVTYPKNPTNGSFFFPAWF